MPKLKVTVVQKKRDHDEMSKAAAIIIATNVGQITQMAMPVKGLKQVHEMVKRVMNDDKQFDVAVEQFDKFAQLKDDQLIKFA